jgi:hypothetical protein
VVWRRVEKRFHNCFWNTKATAVDFDQLLEMTAVSFPKWEFAFRHPIHRTCMKCLARNRKSILIFANTFIYLFNQGAIESWRKWIVYTPWRIYDIDW